jgi:hypothetical protein
MCHVEQLPTSLELRIFFCVVGFTKAAPTDEETTTDGQAEAALFKISIPWHQDRTRIGRKQNNTGEVCSLHRLISMSTQ